LNTNLNFGTNIGGRSGKEIETVNLGRTKWISQEYYVSWDSIIWNGDIQEKTPASNTDYVKDVRRKKNEHIIFGMVNGNTILKNHA